MGGVDSGGVNVREPEPPSAEKLTRQVDRIVRSAAFSGSETLRKLLEYLAARAVEDPIPTVKAKEIAAAVFGRTANFDPQSDSIVRVHASRLRSKLAEYYVSEGAEDELIISIPKGSYDLTVQDRNGHAAAETSRTAPPAPEIADDGASQRAPLRRISGKAAYAAGLVAVAVASWMLARSVQPNAGADMTPALRTFWSGVLDDDQRAIIVYSNNRVRSLSSERTMLVPSNGEVAGVFEITRLFTSVGKDVVPKSPDLVTWDEAQDADLVFVGSPLAETPLRTVPTFHDFAFRRGGPDEGHSIENLKPRKGEPSVFHRPASPGAADYALVALTSPYSPRHRAVTVAGIGWYGTRGAAEFITREDRVQALLSRLSVKHGEPMPRFEAVLRFTVQGGLPVQPEIVAVHRLD